MFTHSHIHSLIREWGGQSTILLIRHSCHSGCVAYFVKSYSPEIKMSYCTEVFLENTIGKLELSSEVGSQILHHLKFII